MDQARFTAQDGPSSPSGSARSLGPNTPTPTTTQAQTPNPRRRKGKTTAMGGGGGHGGTTYKGYTIPHNKRWHTVAGKGLCAVMWFWVFYRAKQDGAVLLGLRHPWDGHDDHSHGHGHGHEHEASSSSSPSH